MAKRGRKSSNELALQGVQITAQQRPDAPYNLNDREVEIWRRVVDSMPADWFYSASFDLLEAYCRHTVSAWKAAKLVEAIENEDGTQIDVDRWAKALTIREREHRAMLACARALRISPSSLKSKNTHAPESVGKKLWEVS